MSDYPLPNHDDYASRPGALRLGHCVFLIDESTSMEARIADGTKPKSEVIATAINSLFGQLAPFAGLGLSVVGYRAETSGVADIGSRFDGALHGRLTVGSEELAAAPFKVETRIRRIPSAGGIGPVREESVTFPVWYAPKLGLMASRAAALEYCVGLLAADEAAVLPGGKPPLIVSFIGDIGAVSGLAAIAEAFRRRVPGVPPLLVHAHLSSSSRIPPTLYPSNAAPLPAGPVRELLEASSALPEPMVGELRQTYATLNQGARGLIVNAKLADLIRFLAVVKAYAAWQPAEETVAVNPRPMPTPLAPAAPQAVVAPLPADSNESALVVLLLDRSVTDPSMEKNVFARIAANANEILGQIAKRGDGRLAAAVVAYGADASGVVETSVGLSGPLSGRTILAAADLTEGALCVEETVEKVSNGIGGIVEWTRKRPIWIEAQAAAYPAECAEAAEAVAAIASEWFAAHQGSRLVVVHLTRGVVDPKPLEVLPAGVVVYHYLTIETPHRSLAYPDHAGQIDQPGAARLWHASARLLAAESLAAKRSGLTAESRGFVVNGKFDLLLDGLLEPTSPKVI